MSPTPKETADICDIAVHCADADMQIMNKYGVEDDELEELLLNNNIERCTRCAWWKEAGDFDEGQTHDLVCSECTNE